MGSHPGGFWPQVEPLLVDCLSSDSPELDSAGNSCRIPQFAGIPPETLTLALGGSWDLVTRATRVLNKVTMVVLT